MALFPAVIVSQDTHLYTLAPQAPFGILLHLDKNDIVQDRRNLAK
jgi:hypothetical protein